MNLDLIVIRLSKKNNSYVNARPCYNCLQMMKNVGINKVHYSTENGLIVEKVKNMVSIHSSAIQIYFEKKYLNYPQDSNEYYKKIVKKRVPIFMKDVNFIFFCKYNLENIFSDYLVKKNKNKRDIYVNNIILFSITII